MISRVSENMKFNMMVNNLFDVQNKHNKLMEQMATQKRINRPSDDPLGMSRILDFRKVKASIGQYRQNIDHCKGWLSITESKLSCADELLGNARQLAIAQATATATAETRKIVAGSVQGIIDGMLALANSKYGDRYIFSGSKTDVQPFSSGESIDATIEDPVAAEGNNFNGGVSVTEGATYDGSVNKTYVVKITAWDADNSKATYNVSDDGGATWVLQEQPLDLSGDGTEATGDIGDGINLTFTDDGDGAPLNVDDIFYVNGLTPGYYNGNAEDLKVAIGKNETISYNILGESAFTDKGEGTVDVFQILNDLKTALDGNDPDGISAQIDKLEDAEEQINLNIARCGTRINRMEAAEGNLLDLDWKVTELMSNTEDADIVELATDLAMKEMALQASYRIAATIGQSTILNFLK